MDAGTAESFYYNYHWFNQFFNDLKTLFEKLAETIGENTEYTDSRLYYYKADQTPQIPSFYYLLMGGTNLDFLQLIAVLDDNIVQNIHLKMKEPSIVVISHQYEDNPNWLGSNILQNLGIKNEGSVDGYSIGRMDFEPYPSFKAFALPLDTFSEYSDEKVFEKIISRLD
jgi:hypothetical protein